MTHTHTFSVTKHSSNKSAHGKWTKFITKMTNHLTFFSENCQKAENILNSSFAHLMVKLKTVQNS